jgi:hypothetical protein
MPSVQDLVPSITQERAIHKSFRPNIRTHENLDYIPHSKLNPDTSPGSFPILDLLNPHTTQDLHTNPPQHSAPPHLTLRRRTITLPLQLPLRNTTYPRLKPLVSSQTITLSLVHSHCYGTTHSSHCSHRSSRPSGSCPACTAPCSRWRRRSLCGVSGRRGSVGMYLGQEWGKRLHASFAGWEDTEEDICKKEGGTYKPSR